MKEAKKGTCLFFYKVRRYFYGIAFFTRVGCQVSASRGGWGREENKDKDGQSQCAWHKQCLSHLQCLVVVQIQLLL